MGAIGTSTPISLDQRAAQLASLRLEQSWADVVRLTHEQNVERAEVHQRWARSLAEEGASLPQSATPQRLEPMWQEEAPAITYSIRGSTSGRGRRAG